MGRLVNATANKQVKWLAHENVHIRFTTSENLPCLVNPPKAAAVVGKGRWIEKFHVWCFQTETFKPFLISPRVVFFFRLFIFLASFICINTKGFSPLSPIRFGRVSLKNQRHICRQHKLEFNYYSNAHSPLFSSPGRSPVPRHLRYFKNI